MIHTFRLSVDADLLDETSRALVEARVRALFDDGLPSVIERAMVLATHRLDDYSARCGPFIVHHDRIRRECDATAFQADRAMVWPEGTDPDSDTEPTGMEWTVITSLPFSLPELVAGIEDAERERAMLQARALAQRTMQAYEAFGVPMPTEGSEADRG